MKITSKTHPVLFRNIKRLNKNTNQLTFQELTNDKYYHNTKGWIKTGLKDQEYNELCELIVDGIIGGRKKEYITNRLRWRNTHHWTLERIFFNSYDNYKTIYISYCAGQDMTWEMNKLRQHLYN